ncbi:hypothetical protein BGX30_002356 [Mortierella sp. GBA39]|nr:hypothetical protein BGX30_002356 [Mortierella sp. GBA39]
MTEMDEWSDLDEIFVATIRGQRHGSRVVTVSSHESIQEAMDIDMVLTDDTQDLGEAIGTDCASAKKRQANEDQSPDDILAHERAKKKQRSWSRKQNKKAKMQAWKQTAGLEAPATTIPATT